MDDAGLVGAIAHLARLGVTHRLGDVRGHGSHLGVGHETTGAQEATQLPDHPHGIRRGDDHVIVEITGLHLLGQVFHAHAVGAGRGRGLGRATLAEDGHADLLADTIGQDGGATHNLVRLARIDAQVDRDIDVFQELDL